MGCQFSLAEEHDDGSVVFDVYHITDPVPSRLVLYRSPQSRRAIKDGPPKGRERGWICGCGLDHRLTTLRCLTCGESLNEFQIHMREGWMRAIQGRKPVPP